MNHDRDDQGVTEDSPLILGLQVVENRVIFNCAIESDFLEFNFEPSNWKSALGRKFSV